MKQRKSSNNQGLRELAAFIEGGYRCYYCKVPTAATIEHIEAYSKGGATHIDNLKLACPYCNTRKGRMEVADFIQSKRWQLEIPADLPPSVRDLLKENYSWEGKNPIRTASAHSRVFLEEDQVFIEIRPGKKYDWQRTLLGKETNPKVIAATYDFLNRHYTTAKTANQVFSSDRARKKYFALKNK